MQYAVVNYKKLEISGRLGREFCRKISIGSIIV